MWRYAGEINEEEAALLVRSLLSAGLDATISAIGMSLYSLARAPDQWAALAANPSLARGAFDETLRYDSPAPRQSWHEECFFRPVDNMSPERRYGALKEAPMRSSIKAMVM